MTEAEIKEFHDSFDRSVRSNERFFDVFYDRFLSSSPEVREKFAGTDFAHQKRMLRLSLLKILEAAVNKQDDLALLEPTALKHGPGGHDIPPHLYELWLDALIDTVRECDRRFTAKTEAVWRTTFRRAINYIVSKY